MTSGWDDATFRSRIQKTLDAWVDDQADRLEPLGQDARRLVASARESLSGGKRLRAAFCYWAYRACATDGITADSDDALVRAASSLEVLHASALVHDDYMDSSETRRGRPATHRAFSELHRTEGMRGDATQFGAAAAILLGDLLLSWADEMLRSCGLPRERVAEALAVLDHTRSEVIVGQFLDVSIQARGRGSVEEAMQVLRYKSAKYSVERPLHLGATLAGADSAVLDQLSAFGLPLGEAFQLRDDLLGVFGDPDATGKPAGDDLIEGKRTVLVALALERADRSAADVLDGRLGTALTPHEVDELRGIIEATGARGAVEAMIDELADRAVAALRDGAFAEPAREVLGQLVDAATRRTV